MQRMCVGGVPLLICKGSGFRVQGSGFRAQVSGFRVQGSGFRAQVSGFRVRVQGAGLPTGLAAGGAEGPPKKSSISPGALAFQLSRGHLSPSTLPHSPMACWWSYFYRKADKSTEVNPVVSCRHRSKMAKVVQNGKSFSKMAKVVQNGKKISISNHGPNPK